jgi:hypothetical protein
MEGMQPGRYFVTVLNEPRSKYEKAHPITLNMNGGPRLGMSAEEAKKLIKQLTKAVEMAERRR